MKNSLLLASLLTLLLCACKKEDTAADLATAGDIVISNKGNGGVLVLDPNGDFKAKLYELDPSSEAIWGITQLGTSNEIAVTVDGTDRVTAISLEDGTSRNLVTSGSLSGTLRGITQLLMGDLLVIEGNNLERFKIDGVRVTSGWPQALQNAGSEVRATSAGGFVLCSTGSNLVGLYDANGTLLQSHSSSIPGTDDATGCRELANGNIAVAWSGTTDTIEILSSDLQTVVASYSDLSKLRAPSSIGQLANGNLVVAGTYYHHLVEISPQGTFVGFLGSAFCNNTQMVIVLQ